ncbi:MAG: cysteine hydrolase [Anaerolineaceae bacterium]|nr:cysteine hydrolase [Anaerolineaceae bacterium]
MKTNTRLMEGADKYLAYLESWLDALPALYIEHAEQTAIMIVDLTNGFCNEGALASSRVKAIVEPTVRLLQNAWDAGVRYFFLLNDTHEPDAVEFNAFLPHCIRGTEESETTAEIRALKFYDQMVLIKKNSLSPSLGTSLAEKLKALPQITNTILAGDCTDLCVYQAAMELRLDANAHQNASAAIIIPEECVATYDLDVETAKNLGAVPHPGDLLHAIYLHQMQLNGIQVVKRVTF